MAADNTNDRLPSAENSTFGAWDWKGGYVSSLAEDGLERFSQYSATPDTTVLYAGPARFTGLAGDAATLIPIGLADNISFQANPSLARLFEIGSNRSYFTRGKTAHAMSLGRMLCDQKSLMMALTQNAYRPAYNQSSLPAAESPNPDIGMNLDSEYFAVPFGLMMLFKTRGGGIDGNGKVLSALYLEYVMMSGFSFQIASTSPVIQEGISLEFDRPLHISLN